MNLPFGVQLKGFIVGVIFALFVWPWIMGLVSGMGNRQTVQA